MPQQLLAGALVYGGDRLEIAVELTGVDPITKQLVYGPIPSDANVVWSKGLSTNGVDLVFEVDGQRLSSVNRVGGPAKVVVLVDKAVASGRLTLNFSCQHPKFRVISDPKDPEAASMYWVNGQFALKTAQGDRPMPETPQPQPPPAQPGWKPENVGFKVTLLDRPQKP